MIVQLLVALAAVPVPIYASALKERAGDPCAAIAGQKWVAPSAAKACLNSFPFNETIRDNLVSVVSKTLNFHTSVTYSLHLPPPFTETSTDIQGRLAKIGKKHYKTDFELHYDLSLAVRSLNDGHAAYLNYCYDGIYSTYLPFPLVNYGEVVHIAPEAYEVALAEFGADALAEWEKAANIKLEKYNGARVLLINGLPPWFAVDQEAAIAGSYQTKPTRENGYFSSYQAAAAGWTYRLGGFAQQSLPIKDEVTLTVIRDNATSIFPETFTIPYRSRIGAATQPFTDGPSFWANNCQPRADTNGASSYPDSSSTQRKQPGTAGRPRFTEPTVVRVGGRIQPISALVDATGATDVVLPPRLQPGQPTSGSGSMQFFLLDDKVTGVLALGSFSGDYAGLYDGLLAGINDLKSRGATRLIVDVTNNGGGYICIAAWLHRLLAGPAPGTTPEPGLDSQARAGDLAQKIVKKIAAGGDPDNLLLYNGQNWRNGDSTRFFNATEDWLSPGRDVVINGVKDRFSQKLGDICLPFEREAPATAPFTPENMVIVGNGRCASSCSLFSINMHIKHGVKTAVVGGRKSATQQYCGIVGGQSLGFADIDSDVKSAGLKSDPLAPPDFIVDAYQGLTWRLGWSILHPDQPEEFQSHPADFNILLDNTLSNNPVAIWKSVAKTVWRK